MQPKLVQIFATYALEYLNDLISQGLAWLNKIKIKTTPVRCDGVFCLSDVYMGLGYGEEAEVIIL